MKKLLLLTLTLCLVFAVFIVPVYAEGEMEETTEVTENEELKELLEQYFNENDITEMKTQLALILGALGMDETQSQTTSEKVMNWAVENMTASVLVLAVLWIFYIICKKSLVPKILKPLVATYTAAKNLKESADKAGEETLAKIDAFIADAQKKDAVIAEMKKLVSKQTEVITYFFAHSNASAELKMGLEKIMNEGSDKV